MYHIKKTLSAAILAASLLPGCSEDMTNREKGELAGAAVGALIGFAIGDDLGLGESTGEVLGAGLGAIAGAMVGGAIGANLDEVDRLKAEVATLSALQMEEETTVRWQSDENDQVSGVVSTKNVANRSSRQCRVVTHIVNIRGEEYRERDTVCRQSDGSWALS